MYGGDMKSLTTIFSICAFWILSATQMSAATLIVDTTTDNAALTACTSATDDCSLRGAIAAAAVGDTITFDSVLFMPTRLIRLTGGNLIINKDLAITGVGGVIIDGNRTDRVFFIQSSGTVNLSGMTVTGGNTAGTGGGIAIAAGTVNLTNMVVTGNVTSGINDLSGGGIYNLGTLNIINSTISDNAAVGLGGRGGGILSLGTLTVTGSIISGNRTGGAGAGGGIYSDNSLIIGDHHYQFTHRPKLGTDWQCYQG